VAAAVDVRAHCRQICEEEVRIDGIIEEAILLGCQIVDPNHWTMNLMIDVVRDFNDEWPRKCSSLELMIT
jgi:hypothetical protein